MHVHLALWGRCQAESLISNSVCAYRGVCACVECILTAMAMAMDDSVTVSMGDEMRGVFRVIFLVNADVKSFKMNQ